jgi:hypothetical protein
MTPNRGNITAIGGNGAPLIPLVLLLLLLLLAAKPSHAVNGDREIGWSTGIS